MALTATISNSTGIVDTISAGSSKEEARSLGRRAQLYVTMKHRDRPELDPWKVVITGTIEDCPVCGSERTVNSTYKRG